MDHSPCPSDLNFWISKSIISQCGPYWNKEGFVEVIHNESQSGNCAPRNPAQASDFLRGESPESHTEQREAGVPKWAFQSNLISALAKHLVWNPRELSNKSLFLFSNSFSAMRRVIYFMINSALKILIQVHFFIVTPPCLLSFPFPSPPSPLPPILLPLSLS